MYTPPHISNSDPLIGLTVHEFRIERRLSQGGMGAVYLARHVVLTSTLKVIKVLLPEYANHPMVRPRFYREAEAASRLQHECILGIDNFGALPDGQLFIMIPYLDGLPLDAYLHKRGGRLSPHRALHLIVQLCDALDHAHARGIVHRDLKPGNVYVLETNSNPYAVKLLDFGIAKLLGAPAGPDTPKTSSGLPMGTPSYMAVEQYEHADQVTHLADIYSLAIVIWEMVTGRLPWQHSDPAVLYHLQRTVIPERPPESEMPPQWGDTLRSALSVDLDARPQSARELAVALASPLPAVGLVPSGAEILAGLARHFVSSAAPGAETVRNASDVNRIGPLLWPPRETAAGAERMPRQDARTSPSAGDGSAQRSTPAGGATPIMLETTLSAATGAVSSPVAGRARRAKLALAAAATAAIGALAVGAVVMSAGAGAGASPTPARPAAPAIPASADAGTSVAEGADASMASPIQADASVAEGLGARAAEHGAREASPRVETATPPVAVHPAVAPSGSAPPAASPPSPEKAAGSGSRPTKRPGAPPLRPRQDFNEDDVIGD